MTRKGIRPPLDAPRPCSEWVHRDEKGRITIIVVLGVRNTNKHFGGVDWKVVIRTKGKFDDRHIRLATFKNMYYENTPEAEGMWLLQELGELKDLLDKD